MRSGSLALTTVWPQTGFTFIQQLSQHALTGDQGCLFASGPYESKWGRKGIWGIGSQTQELVAAFVSGDHGW